MNGKDKISVIIPCYNVQKYIMRCFDSIYSQTYGFENLEVILIDDLSTDNTWSILESLQRKYPENVISLKIQKKGKCGGTRNLGMDICTGKYITFVDADDYVHPDMLRVLHDRMTEDDYDVAQCGVSCFKADKPNVYKFETFIFDSWKYFDDIAILRGKREEDFAPIKNKEGIDSPDTAVELYNKYNKERICL